MRGTWAGRAKPGRRGRVNAQLVLETWLGFEMEEGSVKAISADSIAAKAKFAAGDRVVAIAGEAVESTQEMLAALREAASESEEVPVTVTRDGQKVTLTVRP